MLGHDDLLFSYRTVALGMPQYKNISIVLSPIIKMLFEIVNLKPFRMPFASVYDDS